MAFRNKKERVLEYDPDILVIQECENPAKRGDWSEFSDWYWTGDNENKGLAVFSRNGYNISAPEVEEVTSEHFLPVEVEESKNLLAVWAMNNKENPARRYIGQVYSALQEYGDFVNENTIVAGDFNWNIVWDESPKSSLCGNFSETVGLLNESGLYSSYHRLTDTAFGNEDRATFFMHKKRDREYHIDYVFLPEVVADSVVDFSVGSYDDWIDVSDHMPLMIEYDERA